MLILYDRFANGGVPSAPYFSASSSSASPTAPTSSPTLSSSFSFSSSPHTSSSSSSSAQPTLAAPPADTLALSAVSGFFAGCAAACITNPLDVIKTRLQTSPADAKRSEAVLLKETILKLKREEGWKGFTRGVGARMMNMGPTSILMIITYETVKRLSFMDT
ncbi:hypothetical protein HK104_007502 [Borealophlyctis nickersoniae]|nr:hypothetical protein HK104_007502 [Borealophlyctis nickersoniae]